MAELNMLTYKLQDLQFFNKLETPGQLPLESSFSFSVDYNQNNTRCVAKLYPCVKDKTDGADHRFFVSLEMAGFFEVAGPITDEDKKDFHVMCYQQMFPYGEMLVKQVCTAGGMPNFALPRRKMTRDNVMVNRPADA